MNPERLQRVIDCIDALNSSDPNREEVEGVELPRELVYSQRLTAWVLKLNPEASELLRIAARGQHVERWKSPRDRYPMDRAGYLKWREELKRFHARTVTEIMKDADYTEEEQARVGSIIMKRNLMTDPGVQTLEDALCLVFLETQFPDFRKKESDEKMIDILRKSWKKMSEQGRQVALQLPLGPEELDQIRRALA